MQIRIGLAGLLIAALAACGGGGGSDDAPTVGMQSPSISATAVQRNPATAEITVSTRHFGEGQAIYFELVGGRALLSDFEAGGDFGDVAHMSVTLRNDLPVGTQTQALTLHACGDAACKTEFRGSPMSLTLTATVTPNIDVAAVTSLQRTGADPAPTADVPVTVPAAAGDIFFSPGDTDPGVTLSFSNNVVHVATTQRRAGTYSASARLSGSNPAYFADMSVQYTVNPPAGGEHDMSVDVQNIGFSLNQGDVQARRIVVTPPTWASDYSPLALSPQCDSVYSLADLGNDTYELTASAVGQDVRLADVCTLGASAGGEGVQVWANTQIGQAFGVTAPQPFTIARDTPASALQQTVAVTMTDGSAATWSASTSSPWLRLARTHGTTGVDGLGLALDTSHLGAWLPGDTAHVQVSVDRPNVPAQDVAIGLGFAASWMNDAWAGTFTGGAGRLYVAGQFEPDIATNHEVSVSGARMTALHTATDPFFVGNVQVLQIDVDQVVDGQPITVALTTPWLATQASVPVSMDRGYAAGFAPLPFGARKPPSFSAANGALYFAGQDTVWRYASTGSGWALSSAALPGVIDVDPRPDESHLLAVSETSVAMLDSVTLQATWSGAPVSDYFGSPAAIVGGADVDSKSVLHTTDGNAWVTYAMPSAAAMASTGVGQLTLGLFDATAPTGAHINQSRGQISFAATSSGAPAAPWMIASADRQAVLATSANASDATALMGETLRKLDVDQPFGPGAPVAPFGEASFAWPTAPAAVSAYGYPALRTDGELWYSMSGYMHSADLRSLVPSGQTAGGWGLTRDGALVLLYTYQITGSGSAATASQPTLHVFQLKAPGSALPTVPPTEIATIALAGLPGCGSPLASGETCQHTAHVLVDPASTVVFVAGPRGVAAVPLPPSVTALTTLRAATRTKAASEHSGTFVRRGVKRS